MKINKSLDIDLNIISPQKHIQIHEGDIDSIDIVLAVSVDDVSLDLTGLTIKYDATINNYLAEQDANGSVVENKIVIPVTENMTAMPGLLLVDVRMIQGAEILFTQTISAIVDKAVVNGSTYIDFSKITINQRMNALEEQMAHVEEIVDGLNTSKQITSIYRPPQTVPATVDVDFFRVGDTWIYQDSGIVYKLIGADYNYQLGPMIPAVHKFRWQPLNEYFSYGIVEPPTSATYTPIGYVIGELTFNAFPVPEYFIGDTYAKVVSGAVETLFTLTDSAEVSSGQYTFSWHENGSGFEVISNKVSAITDENQESETLYPSVKAVVDNVKAVVDYVSPYKDDRLPPHYSFGYADNHIPFDSNDRYLYKNDYDGIAILREYILDYWGGEASSGNFVYFWTPMNQIVAYTSSAPPTQETPSSKFYRVNRKTYKAYPVSTFYNGDILVNETEGKAYLCTNVNINRNTNVTYNYTWTAYYMTEQIDSMIGDIGTALDMLNDNLAEV